MAEEVLTEMDMLERITFPDGYRKVCIPVICQESGEEISVWAYGKLPAMLQGAQIMAELSGEYCLEHAALYRSRQDE